MLERDIPKAQLSSLSLRKVQVLQRIISALSSPGLQDESKAFSRDRSRGQGNMGPKSVHFPRVRNLQKVNLSHRQHFK